MTISVAGGQANGITYIMDGGTHNDPFNNLNLPMPFPDALQEFKVETSSLPARYGHHAASAVNAVTKSGTNAFHGNVFEFVRDYRFNARNFFAPTRDSLKRNQFGGTLGGPILKDKLFFFGGYQGTIEKSNPPKPSASCRRRRCWRATSPRSPRRRAAAARSRWRRPPVRQQPDRSRALQPGRAEVPASTCRSRPIRAAACSTAFRTTTPSTRRLRRGDYTLNSNQSLFGATCMRSTTIPATYDGTNALTLSRTGQNNQVHSLVAGHNWMLSSTMVNSLPRRPGTSTVNDRPMPLYFSPSDLGASGLQPAARLHGRERDERLQHRRRRDQPRLLQLRQLPDRQRLDMVRGRHQFVVRRQLDPHARSRR